MNSMQNRDILLVRAEGLLAEGHEMQEVLRFVPANGCTIVESIKATMQLTGVSLGNAKQLVHTSEDWNDLRASHDAFHHALIEHVEAIDREPVGRHPKDGSL